MNVKVAKKITDKANGVEKSLNDVLDLIKNRAKNGYYTLDLSKSNTNIEVAKILQNKYGYVLQQTTVDITIRWDYE